MASLPHEKPLAILVRPRETGELRASQNSLEVNVPEDSMGSQPAFPLPSLPHSQTMDSTGWQSPPATPPPDAEMESQLMDGIGCLFPIALPSRATSLSMEGDNGAGTPASLGSLAAAGDADNARETHGLPIFENDDFLATPRPDLGTWDTPTRSALLGGASIFGSVLLPLTPGLTPKRKGTSDSPSSPPPAKRMRSQTLRADQDAREFHTARQLTMHLLGSTSGSSADAPEAEQEGLESANASSRSGSSSSDTLSAPRRAPASLHALEVEFLSEDEIEAHLAELVSAYRAFHLDPDENELPSQQQQQPPDGSARAAAASRDTLRAVFVGQLRSAEDEQRLLLRGEEEDVLNALAAWVRETQVPASGVRRETFQDVRACLERLRAAATGERFVKQIRCVPELALLLGRALPSYNSFPLLRCNGL
ncbi:hypothetical protein C8A05DRAFT_15365 [Staphylotrichum tortipilum]|uniref:Uncharacterized protein n=1 Tax=Staphylotrichum tortipilum TaxID=2831512 RepID=A0AAN6RTN7_9PEZI|nr:hypothetical protein C8A05DRAFT_15365 [Staphylotrichum longicolle]